MRIHLALTALILLAECRRDEPPPVPRATGDLIPRTEEELIATEHAIDDLGLRRRRLQALACVRRARPGVKGPMHPGPGELSALAGLHERKVVQRIISADVALSPACDERDVALVHQVAGTIQSSPRLEDLVVLSDTIIIARVAGPLRPERRGDGLRSSVPLVVEEAIKGDLQAGLSVVARSPDGPAGDGTYISYSGGPSFRMGKRYLVLASRMEQRIQASRHGGPTAPRTRTPALIPNGGAWALDESQVHLPDGPIPAAEAIRRVRDAARTAPPREAAAQRVALTGNADYDHP